MVTLKIFKDDRYSVMEAGANSEVILKESMEEAVSTGQESGCYYEIYDPVSGQTLDWTEVNYREEDSWCYDEEELIWKKRTADESGAESMRLLFNTIFQRIKANLEGAERKVYVNC